MVTKLGRPALVFFFFRKVQEKMAFIIGNVKCFFCGKKQGFFHSCHGYGIYADEIKRRVFYHPECLELVQMYPEIFGHRKVDRALVILDQIKKNKRQINSDIISNHEKKRQKLLDSHFENMMPSKK